MQYWLFFTIFGLVITVPVLITFLIFNRFKNTIAVLIKRNGSLTKVIIDDKILKIGQITKIDGQKVKPIKVEQSEIYYGKFRRWIIKGELESTKKETLTDKEVEEYLNNEDLIKLYLAGKFKDTLIALLVIILVAVIIGIIVNGYLISNKECILSPTNMTTDYLRGIVRSAIINISSS